MKNKPNTPTCDYLERNAAGKLAPCGDPAEFRAAKPTAAGHVMHYCQSHGDFLRRQIELETLAGVSLGKPIRWSRKTIP